MGLRNFPYCEPSDGLFKQAKSDVRFNMFYSTGGHTEAPSVSFQYTFDDGELGQLVDQDTASVIVHHGDMPVADNYTVVHCHFEGLPLFVSKATQIDCIRSDDLTLLFSGRIANWKYLRGSDNPVDIGIRGDGVFLRSSQSILHRNSLWITRDVFAGNSYDELASFGCQKPGAILIGLRGPLARASCLTEIKLDDQEVSSATCDTYPLSGRLSLLLRKNDSLAVELGEAFAGSLKERWCEDGMEVKAQPVIEKLRRVLRQIRAQNHGRVSRLGMGVLAKHSS
jgi:hypothetical protein